MYNKEKLFIAVSYPLITTGPNMHYSCAIAK